jgi:hypothetical protein
MDGVSQSIKARERHRCRLSLRSSSDTRPTDNARSDRLIGFSAMIQGAPVLANAPGFLASKSFPMDPQDFDNLYQLMLLDLVAALDKFSQSEQNHSVYAIAIGMIREGEPLSLRINGERDSPRFDQCECLDVYREKYNAFTFKYFDDNVFSSDVVSLFTRFRTSIQKLVYLHDIDSKMSAAKRQQIGLEVDRLYLSYFGTLFKTLNRLNATFAGVDRTANCVFYVDLGNNDEQSRRQHLEAVIPPKLFDSIFPAYREQDSSAAGEI